MDEHYSLEDQYDPQNQPRPPGWDFDSLKVDEVYRDLRGAINIMHALRIDRPHLAPIAFPPAKEVLDRPEGHTDWILDPFEQRLEKMSYLITQAVLWGDIETHMVFDDRETEECVETDAFEVVLPIDVFRWVKDQGFRLIPEVAALLAEDEQPGPAKTNPGKAAAAQHKRESTFAAALVILDHFGVERFVVGDDKRLNISAIGREVIKHQKALFDEGEAPLSEAVFARQFSTMRGRLKSHLDS